MCTTRKHAKANWKLKAIALPLFCLGFSAFSAGVFAGHRSSSSSQSAQEDVCATISETTALSETKTDVPAGLLRRSNAEVSLPPGSNQETPLLSRLVDSSMDHREPRLALSVSPRSPLPLEHLLAPPPLEHLGLLPSLEHFTSPPPLLSPWTPLVFAGVDITIELNNAAVLFPEVLSNTTQGLAILWEVVTGPGTATFVNPDLPRTEVRFSAPGLYELELTVSNAFASASDRVQVQVIPEPCNASLVLCSTLLSMGRRSRWRQRI